VHQGQRAFEIRVMEIREILGQLAGSQHALVNHCAGRKAGDIEVLAAGEGLLGHAVHAVKLGRHFVEPDGVAHAFADDIKHPLKLHRICDLGRTLDEDLLDLWLVAG